MPELVLPKSLLQSNSKPCECGHSKYFQHISSCSVIVSQQVIIQHLLCSRHCVMHSVTRTLYHSEAMATLLGIYQFFQDLTPSFVISNDYKLYRWCSNDNLIFKKITIIMHFGKCV